MRRCGRCGSRASFRRLDPLRRYGRLKRGLVELYGGDARHGTGHDRNYRPLGVVLVWTVHMRHAARDGHSPPATAAGVVVEAVLDLTGEHLIGTDDGPNDVAAADNANDPSLVDDRLAPYALVDHRLGDIGQLGVRRGRDRVPGHDLRDRRRSVHGAGVVDSQPMRGRIFGYPMPEQVTVADHADQLAALVEYRRRRDLLVGQQFGRVLEWVAFLHGVHRPGHDVLHTHRSSSALVQNLRQISDGFPNDHGPRRVTRPLVTLGLTPRAGCRLVRNDAITRSISAATIPGTERVSMTHDARAEVARWRKGPDTTSSSPRDRRACCVWRTC